MSRLEDCDVEIVEGVVEFFNYMTERAENPKLKKALAEGEKNWTMVLDATKNSADRKESVA